jgi:hypothetical protein
VSNSLRVPCLSTMRFGVWISLIPEAFLLIFIDSIELRQAAGFLMARKEQIIRKKRLYDYMKRYMRPTQQVFLCSCVDFCRGLYSSSFFDPSHCSPASVEAAAIPGEYIVVFKDTSSDAGVLSHDNERSSVSKRDEIKNKFKLKTKRHFSHVIDGFSASLSSSRCG